MQRNRQKYRNPQDPSVVGLLNTFDIVLLVTVLLVVAGFMILYFAIPNLVTDGETCGIGNLKVPCLDFRNFVQSIATNAIPVGLTSVLGYLILRHYQNLREMQKNRDLALLVAAEIEPSLAHHAGIQKKFVKYGITDCYKSLDEVKEKALELPCSDIRIMTTWFTHADVLHEIFINAAKQKGYQIRILLLDPSSKAAEQRSKDLKDLNVGDVRTRIRECRNDLESLNQSGMEIRYYNVLPSFPLYIFNNHAYFGVFPHIFPADFGPWLEIHLRDSDNNHTEIGRFLEKELEKVWKEAVNVKRWDQQK
jgi:hypothetical protein